MRAAGPEQPHDVVVEAFISNHSTCTIECPRCRRRNGLNVSDLPPSHPNPFAYQCACGLGLKVRLIGFRGGHRKPVSLAASFVRLADPKSVRRLCEVEDLSVKGMRFTSEFTRNLAVRDEITLVLVLDDERRTKLEVPATVTRLVPAPPRMTVGVEFMRLNAEHHTILQQYVTSEAS